MWLHEYLMSLNLKKPSLLSVFAKLLCALPTQARESHMRSEKIESLIFILENNSWQNSNTVPHRVSPVFYNQLVDDIPVV